MYVFRTRLPVAIKCIATLMLPLDLHVLSLPLAFILSQDQTLRCKKEFKNVLTQIILSKEFPLYSYKPLPSSIFQRTFPY